MRFKEGIAPFACTGGTGLDLARLDLLREERAQKLMEKFWPGPRTLALALPKSDIVSDISGLYFGYS